MVEPSAGGLPSLQNHDYAFVRRSDGSFTYTVLAFQTEKLLTFVVDAS